MVRVVTVATVISVHSVSNLLPTQQGAAGVVLTVFHSSREVFLVLTGLVLTWSAASRPMPAVAFWRKRAPLVLAPYLAWTLVYFLAGGATGGIGRLALDVTDAGAHFHLYFLLLTLQMYLVMPWVLPWVRARAARPWALLAASAALQLAFTSVVQWGWWTPPPISWLAHNPGTWLPSYQFYVVAGVLVGLHAEAVTRWCSQRVAWLGSLAVLACGASIALYAASVAGGTAPITASEVFQPAVVVEAVALGAFELGLGERLTRDARASTRRALVLCSDLSFGVYLAHPLLLSVLIDWTGTIGWLADLPSAAAVAVTVLVVVPVIAGVTGIAVNLVRSTPLSLPATGRPRRRRATPTPSPTPATRATPTGSTQAAPDAPARLAAAGEGAG